MWLELWGPSAVKNSFKADNTSARRTLSPSGKFCPRFFKNSLNTWNDVAIALGGSTIFFCLWFPGFKKESNWCDWCCGHSHVKQVFLLSGPGRICCTCESQAENNTFLEQFPHSHAHFWWLSNNLANYAFVPKAILQPHTSRRQLKLPLWAPSWGFGFPEVRSVFQRLAHYIQQLGAVGSPFHTWTHPDTPLKHFPPVTSRFPGLLSIFLAISYPYLVQPWTTETCHPEALPSQVPTILHPLSFCSVDITFSIEPLNVSVPWGKVMAPFHFLSLLFPWWFWTSLWLQTQWVGSEFLKYISNCLLEASHRYLNPHILKTNLAIFPPRSLPCWSSSSP